jgi:hypothetical protein
MTARIYNCKSEEVPVIGRYVLFVLKRDWADFAAYLPKLFADGYVTGFEQKIVDVNNLLNPQSETVERKNTTSHLYSVMDGLIEPADKVAGYIRFTKGAIPVSAKDFGLTALKHKVRSKDSEGVLKNLRTVIANIELYRTQLIEQGCDEKTITHFSDALTAIETDNQRQFEIVSKRKTIVENNVNLINDLYKTIIEICDVGKTIYKGKNELKVRDYTFTELKKAVRITKS